MHFSTYFFFILNADSTNKNVLHNLYVNKLYVAQLYHLLKTIDNLQAFKEVNVDRLLYVPAPLNVGRTTCSSWLAQNLTSYLNKTLYCTSWWLSLKTIFTLV